MIHIATISGGKDSVTMCDLLLKNGYQVDYIVFNDTLDEFKEMYEYIEKVEDYFKQRYGKLITRLNPKKSYDEYIFHKKTSGENIGLISGVPSPTAGYCEWRRDSKLVPFERWAKKFGEYKIYMGITRDEPNRIKRGSNFLYPLYDDFKMTENDCKEYLINQDMENPLYRHFNRTGCKKCQYQSEKDWYMVWKNYQYVWEELKDYEERVAKLEAVNKNWFIGNKNSKDMERIFKSYEKQNSLFDLSEEPIKDCFCKI